MYRCFFKRLLDIFFSVAGVVILALPMLIIAVIIKINSPGPALFKQKRVGLNKKEFVLYKFRSMPVSAPSNVATHSLKVDDIHMTKFQRTIRKYSIDELPQLFNIFLGHCSMIGPRPVICDEYDLIALREKYGANDVKPGLSGLAQINGRDTLDNEKKARFDGEYTKVLKKGGFKAFFMDIKCFFGTIKIVVKTEGFVEGGTHEEEKEEVGAAG